jgi:hypothetical protein
MPIYNMRSDRTFAPLPLFISPGGLLLGLSTLFGGKIIAADALLRLHLTTNTAEVIFRNPKRSKYGSDQIQKSSFIVSITAYEVLCGDSSVWCYTLASRYGGGSQIGDVD